MDISIEDFLASLHGDVRVRSSAVGETFLAAFFNELCENYLEASGALDFHEFSYFAGMRGVRIDGHGGDPLETGNLRLMLVDTDQTAELQTLTATALDAHFKRVRSFLEKSRDPSFRASLERTDPVSQLAELINQRWDRIEKIELIVLTDKILSSRVDGRASAQLEGKLLVHSVWDLGRLAAFAAQGHEREDIEIDLAGEFGGAIPALRAHLDGATYEAYLLVLPGEQLARIYERWDTRLLESNVRVFLQARGGVNKGIKTTIETQPEMFLAYNNGVTATADEVLVTQDHGALAVKAIRNLQIVNGGQTTASLHAALRRKTDLSRVFVQMKLAVIPSDRAMEVVPRISEFANSQNTVKAADFFANHPFHVRIEGFSRRIVAPAADGSFKVSKWFYERARGQYPDARAKLSAGAQKQFDLEYPKMQLFTKTDLAKYDMVWRELPHIVSRGAQKTFAAFAELLGKEWDKDSDLFTELYYRESIAKAIVFRATEKLVSAQEWYDGGYRAQVVAHGLAKVVHDARSMAGVVDLAAVWQRQSLGAPLEQVIAQATKAAHDIITSPPPGQKNMSEWAKQQACWDRVMNSTIPWGPELKKCTIPLSEYRADVKDAKKDQSLLNGIQLQTLIVTAGASFWSEFRDWAKTNSTLSPKELAALAVCTAMPRKVPKEWECELVYAAFQRAKSDGCDLTLPD